MYDATTEEYLRSEIEQANIYRQQQDSKVREHRGWVAAYTDRIAEVDARLADLKRLLDFHTLRDGDELAHAFSNAVLDRSAEHQAEKDAEAQADAWSTAEQIEHDQDCELAQDAADQERWAAEAALDAESGV